MQPAHTTRHSRPLVGASLATPCFHAGGMTACSRWLSEALRATPPVKHRNKTAPWKGASPAQIKKEVTQRTQRTAEFREAIKPPCVLTQTNLLFFKTKTAPSQTTTQSAGQSLPNLCGSLRSLRNFPSPKLRRSRANSFPLPSLPRFSRFPRFSRLPHLPRLSLTISS